MTAEGVGTQLNELLQKAGLDTLDDETASKFEAYLSLFVRWNKKLNLSSVRDEEGILSRHFVESIAVAQAIPPQVATLLDFGSGAGLPGIPIALCRRRIAVTLADSRVKKAAFLQEAVRVLGISAKVHADRADKLTEVFDCVVMRAVEKMPRAVIAAVNLIAPQGWLALMTTDTGLADLQKAAGTQFNWKESIRLPGGVSRILSLGRKADPQA
jgi:16S rRNA (guanine527-N7)-methyltransferase